MTKAEKTKEIKKIVIFLFLLFLISCKKENITPSIISENIQMGIEDTITAKQHNNEEISSLQIKIEDTIIVKLHNKDSYYKNSFSYYWVTHKDTLGFNILVREYQLDSVSGVSLDINHRKNMLFTTAIKRIEECLKVIDEDFETTKLTSLQFELPILYQDISNKVSKDYLDKFGEKEVGQDQLSDFLMDSHLNVALEEILNPINKSIINYRIDKFHLTRQKHYINNNSDTSSEPAINGVPILVRLKNKQ